MGIGVWNVEKIPGKEPEISLRGLAAYGFVDGWMIGKEPEKGIEKGWRWIGVVPTYLQPLVF